ncbi:hypothetical protein S1OALGB6SA_409 [Olavius algarvensis spirochete endosymbiont]|uniref:flagellar FliJ family protein n=1 Tax=Olavius algarvensis spirochete endosymbiont TaxID=260710 RepID=UPI000F280A3E|nr:flagellar FliJ family protein [Olavius algarvensis spirochete endosymbiont]VDA99341.1 hypothetical protein S1OALGB6SA_409 [Olavius algarvensis spirochete endosymbiont]
MRKFRFSLAALLSLRKERTRECESLLASELGKLAMMKNQIENTRRAEAKALFASRANLDELRVREHLLRKTLNERKVLKTQLIETEKKVEEVRHAFLEARSKSAALEKLREKRKNHWISTVKKEELRNLDETARGAALRLDVTGGGK